MIYAAADINMLTHEKHKHFYKDIKDYIKENKKDKNEQKFRFESNGSLDLLTIKDIFDLVIKKYPEGEPIKVVAKKEEEKKTVFKKKRT